MRINYFRGDAKDALSLAPSNFFDAGLTDPPYALRFRGERWDYKLPEVAIWEEHLRVLCPGAYMLVYGAARTHHRLAVSLEDAGFILVDVLFYLYGNGLPKGQSIGAAADKLLQGRPRKDRDEPETMHGALWDGYASQLKPAYEAVILVRKPPEESNAINAIMHGTGGLNISGSLIGGSRFPANVQLDEAAAEQLDLQAGERKSGSRKAGVRKGLGYGGGAGDGGPAIEGSTGGASRFFYTSKASRGERDAGLDKPNPHKTVKPLDLSTHYAKLLLPPKREGKERHLLNCYSGSGTETIAAFLAGWEHVISIDNDPANEPLLFARAKHWLGVDLLR